MKNLRFGLSSDAPDGAAVARGVYVTQRKKSGGKSPTCGNDKRERRLREGEVNTGTAQHKRLHRGIDPKTRRIIETASMPKRSRSMKS